MHGLSLPAGGSCFSLCDTQSCDETGSIYIVLRDFSCDGLLYLYIWEMYNLNRLTTLIHDACIILHWYVSYWYMSGHVCKHSAIFSGQDGEWGATRQSADVKEPGDYQKGSQESCHLTNIPGRWCDFFSKLLFFLRMFCDVSWVSYSIQQISWCLKVVLR